MKSIKNITQIFLFLTIIISLFVLDLCLQIKFVKDEKVTATEEETQQICMTLKLSGYGNPSSVPELENKNA